MKSYTQSDERIGFHEVKTVVNNYFVEKIVFMHNQVYRYANSLYILLFILVTILNRNDLEV